MYCSMTLCQVGNHACHTEVIYCFVTLDVGPVWILLAHMSSYPNKMCTHVYPLPIAFWSFRLPIDKALADVLLHSWKYISSTKSMTLSECSIIEWLWHCTISTLVSHTNWVYVHWINGIPFHYKASLNMSMSNRERSIPFILKVISPCSAANLDISAPNCFPPIYSLKQNEPRRGNASNTNIKLYTVSMLWCVEIVSFISVGRAMKHILVLLHYLTCHNCLFHFSW